MKKSFKQMLSLLLCLCMLLGMPLAVSVSAADETPLTLTSWTVVDDTKVVMAFSEAVNLPADGADFNAYVGIHADDMRNLDMQYVSYEWDSTSDSPTQANLWSSKTAKWSLVNLEYYDNDDHSLVAGTINTGDANFTFTDIQKIDALFKSTYIDTWKWSHLDPKIAVSIEDSTKDDQIQALTSKTGKTLAAEIMGNSGAWAYKSYDLQITNVEAVSDTQIVFSFSEAVNVPAADASYTAGIAIRHYQNGTGSIDETTFASAGFSSDETGQHSVSGVTVFGWNYEYVNWTLSGLSHYEGDSTKLVGTLSGNYTYGDAKKALIAMITKFQASQTSWTHIPVELVAYISDTSIDTSVSAVTSKEWGSAKPLVSEQLSDKSWAEMKLTPGESAIAATPVSDTSVLLSFEAPVIIKDASKIKWGSKQGTGVVEDTTSARTSWTVTFAEKGDDTWIQFSSMAIRKTTETYDYGQTGAYRLALLPLAGWGGMGMTGTEQNALTDGTKYNMMNADTGRDIVLGEDDEFTLVNADTANTYYIKNGNKYLNLLGSTPVETDTAISYWIEKNDNGRYRIMVDNAAIEDTNEGETNAATLGLVAATDKWLSTGWYFTASGEDRPVRMMAMGDSITFGYAAGQTYEHGWRDELSAQLDAYLDRNFVFVGPRVSKQAWLDSTELYRHAGYSGYFIDVVDENVPEKYATPAWLSDGVTNDMGFDTFVDDIVSKYAPDVTFLMLGTNDTSKICWFTHYSTSAKYTDEGQMNDEGGLFDRYETLIGKLAPALADNGSVIVSKLTPHSDPTGYHGTAINVFNDRMDAFVADLQANQLSVYLNDNNTGFPADGLVDNVHMSDSGNDFISSRYLGTYKSIYGTDGNKKTVVTTGLQAALDAAADGETVVAGKNEAIDLLKIPAGVTLDLNGQTVTATYLLSFGNVIDSTEGNGGIKVSKDPTKGLVSLQAANRALPLYEEDFGGYRFFTYELQNLGSKDATDASIKYGMRIVLPNNTAYDLLAANTDLKVTMQLSVTATSGQTSTMDYIFKSTTVEKYATDVQTKPTYAITLTVNGIEAVDSLSAMPTITSPTGVYAATQA